MSKDEQTALAGKLYLDLAEAEKKAACYDEKARNISHRLREANKVLDTELRLVVGEANRGEGSVKVPYPRGMKRECAENLIEQYEIIADRKRRLASTT